MGARAGRSGALPRRAGAAPRGDPVHRLRRPRRPPRARLPRRGRRVRDAGRRPAGRVRRPRDVIAREQYLDFFKGRMFRQTLLCHAGRRAPRADAATWSAACSPPRRRGRWARSARGASSSAARAARRITTDHDAVKAALVRARRRVAARRAGRRAGRRRGLRGAAARLRGQPRAAARVGAGDRGRAVRAAGRERAGAPAGRRRPAHHEPAPRERSRCPTSSAAA